MAQLRSITCHMESHSVTCYPTEVNTPLTYVVKVNVLYSR